MALKRDEFDKVAGFDLEGIVEGTHIIFTRHRDEERGTTEVWAVFTSNWATRLGTIKWFGRFRKYSFFPEANTVFEDVCMGDIIEFGKELMDRWRLAKKATKA